MALQNVLELFFFILLRHGFDVVAEDVFAQTCESVGDEQSRLMCIITYNVGNIIYHIIIVVSVVEIINGAQHWEPFGLKGHDSRQKMFLFSFAL